MGEANWNFPIVPQKVRAKTGEREEGGEEVRGSLEGGR